MALNLIDDEDDAMPHLVVNNNLVSPTPPLTGVSSSAVMTPSSETVGQKRSRLVAQIDDDCELLFGGKSEGDATPSSSSPATVTFRTKGGDGVAKMSLLAFGNGKRGKSSATSLVCAGNASSSMSSSAAAVSPVSVKVVRNSHTEGGEKDRKVPRFEGPAAASPKSEETVTTTTLTTATPTTTVTVVAPPPPPPPVRQPLVLAPPPVVSSPPREVTVVKDDVATSTAPDVPTPTATTTGATCTIGLVRAPPPPPPPKKAIAKKSAVKGSAPTNQPKLDFFSKFKFTKKEPAAAVADATSPVAIDAPAAVPINTHNGDVPPPSA